VEPDPHQSTAGGSHDDRRSTGLLRRPVHAIASALQKPAVTRLGRLGLTAAVAVLVGLGAVVAYLQEFSMVPVWDDQGYMMLSVRHLLDGHRLYDDIRVFYGPLYYLVTWVLHGPLGLPLTHDGVRMISLALRGATATVAACAVFRMTRGVVLAVFTLLTLGAGVFTIMPEAGHPQELVVLLVAAMPVITRADRPWSSVVGLALLVAGLCMIKLNVGTFAGVAVWMAVLSSTATSRTIAVVRMGSLAVCLLLPWILLREALVAGWARALASLVTMWIAAAAAASFTRRDETLRPLHLVAFIAAVGAGTVAIALFPLARGSSVRALGDSLILGTQALTRTSVFPLPLHPWSVAVAAAGLVGSIWWARVGAPRAAPGSVACQVAAASKLVFGIVAVLVSQSSGAPHLLLSGITPFAWLVLLPGGQERARLPRLVLAWVAVLGSLQVYPVPGSQLVCATMPGLLCALVCLGDGCAWLISLLPSEVRRPAAAATVGLALTLLIIQTRSAFALWNAIHGVLVPLGMPGATRMRVTENTAVATQGLVSELQTHCTSFLVFPGVSSLYFWTGSEPPTLDLVPNWTRLISDERLAAMEGALLRSSSPCVVRCTGLLERIPDPRVEEWLQGRFRPGPSFGSCTVWEHAW
jgi:hypothetical protein